ncbi:MAG: hypothetical protein ABSF97_09180 [Candidatus Sulfotelmatobacter sp.]|jgi:hypothetical protein
MRKALAVFTIAILGFMIGSRATTVAQDSAAKPEMNAKPSKRAEKPVHAYRVDFSLNELEDGKKINTRQYSVNVNSDESNEIKIGTRVPVESKEGEFQYMDVGTNVWCRIEERSDGVALSVRAENSNFAIPDQGTGHDARPVIRQLKISGSTLALLGKPMIVGSMDDPNSKRQFQLEVTVTKLR